MLDAIRADLEARARAGDTVALDILIDAIADGMPARTRRRWRDQAIIATASWLATLLPDLRPARAATMIVAAGNMLDSGAAANVRALGRLTRPEMAELLARMRPIVEATPRRARGNGWLTTRQAESILKPHDEI